MLDHVSITASDMPAAERFYDAIMKALGVVKVGRREEWLGYGERARPAYPDRVYLSIRKGERPEQAPGRHWCFKARGQSQVDAFWDAGIAAGGTDDGPPGLRDYHASYYAAFLRDPDGNRIEAVCHHPLSGHKMQTGQPSQTALGAAAHRAVHQTLEGGVIFADPFALQILSDDTRARLPDMAGDPAHRPMRLFIAARSRFSEDTMAACVARGVRQIVILGAGLDTFSLRNPHAGEGARVFEVDYPATQAWKRERLAQAGLALPASLVFAPVDFEQQGLSEGLAAAGFRVDQPAYFQWLGVVPYLTREAIIATLDFIAGIAGSEVVFDYGEPLENYSPAMRANLTGIAERAAAIGEPWLSQFDPADMKALLRARGFAEFEDVTRAELAGRYYGDLGQGLTAGPGPHLVRAASL